MSNLVSLSVCGRDTFVGDGATLADFRFDGKCISVQKHGATIDSGITFLGGCLGHGAYLGAGCILAPGRVLPNGWRICKETGVVKGAGDRRGVARSSIDYAGESRRVRTTRAGAFP